MESNIKSYKSKILFWLYEILYNKYIRIVNVLIHVFLQLFLYYFITLLNSNVKRTKIFTAILLFHFTEVFYSKSLNFKNKITLGKKSYKKQSNKKTIEKIKKCKKQL